MFPTVNENRIFIGGLCALYMLDINSIVCASVSAYHKNYLLKKIPCTFNLE